MNEAINVEAKRFGYFPRTFVWRRRRYEVINVERTWTTNTRDWGGRAQRHYFRVRCAEGVFELFQSTASDIWHLTRFDKVGA